MKEDDEDPRRKSSRYPYDYSADVIRMLGPYDLVKPGMALPRLSRPQAAELETGLAKALGVERRELAEMLANYYLENEGVLVEMQASKVDLLVAEE